MYNLLEYSDNYADSSRSLYQFKIDEQNMNNAGNPADVTVDANTGLASFKYKSSISGSPAANGVLRNAKIVVPLQYVSSFFRSSEMPFINCKIHLELGWTKDFVMSNIVGATTFQITSAKLYVPIVTLSTKDNVNLTKQLNGGFKRFVYWNEYKSKMDKKQADDQNPTRFYLDASFQRARTLSVLTFDDTTVNNDGANRVKRNSHRKYFLPRVNITNYNVLIDGRHFYDQPINDQIKKYDVIKKISTGFGVQLVAC